MKWLRVCILVISSLFMFPSIHFGLDYPRGPVILTVGGMVDRTNNGGEAKLDAAALRSLPQVQIETETPWTEGKAIFEGPLLRDVLKLVGAQGQVIRATAMNDYSVDIPTADAEMFDVILAMRLNSKDMTIRSKGPLWLIYPWGENEQLRSETYYSRSIWQLVNLDVQ